MKRLPHVDDLIQLIHQETVKTEKTASVQSEVPVEFVVPAAEGLYKVAEQLRSCDPEAVTYSDVEKFASQLLESAQ